MGSPLEPGAGDFFLSCLFSFAIIIYLQHFSLSPPPSKPSHMFLLLSFKFMASFILLFLVFVFYIFK